MIINMKVSEYTPFLLIGLVITFVARHFYDPLQITNLLEIALHEEETMSLPFPVMRGIMTVIFPIGFSFFELLGYMFEVTEAINDGRIVFVFTTALTCYGYMIITYRLEKFHAYWHEEEGVLAVCVDMLCIENIVMYIFNIASYAVGKLFQWANIPDVIYMGILLVLVLPLLWGLMLQTLYFFIAALVCLGIPMLITLPLENVLGETPMVCIMIGLWILFSQVIWRLCSAFVYDKLLHIFSFRRLSL